jgi:prepilin-type N-terminal cleavage/methylation domain-containing protein
MATESRARRAARAGFTLVELAVVLAIVTLLLGSLMYTLSAQVEQRNFEETRRRLDQARELLLTFAIVKGRLPCPARYTSAASHSSGQESFCTGTATGHTTTCAGTETTTEQAHGTCSNHFDGFLPAASIGFQQADADGFALDAWGNRIRYGVARSIASGTCAGTMTPTNLYETMFTSKTLLQRYGITCQPANLIVCKSGTGITETIPTSCGGAANQIMVQDLLVAVLLSTGKNGATGGGTGTDEAPNINTGPVFVWHTPTAPGVINEFDDQMTWIAVGELYGRLISAGVLP